MQRPASQRSRWSQIVGNTTSRLTLLVLTAVVMTTMVATQLHAQQTPTGPSLRTLIETTSQGVAWTIPRSHRSVVTFVDDNIYCLVRREAESPRQRSAVLLRSADQGENWQEAATIPDGGSVGFGAIAGQKGSELVHVLWNSTLQDGFSSVYYQAFDGSNWIGEPETLATGRGKNDQYQAEDFRVAADGTLIAVLSAHRHPRAPWQFWGTGIHIRGPEETEWSPLFLASGDATGIAPNLQVHEQRAYLSYRSSVPSHGIYVRVFDLKTRQWLGDQTHVSKPGDPIHSANTSSLVIDNSGNLYVLFGAGVGSSLGARAGRPEQGELRLAFARDCNLQKLEYHTVDLDPGLRGGNLNPEHFSLARGPGDQVLAFYSKLSENHGTLYQATFMDGHPVGKPKAIATGQPHAFRTVNGLRGWDSVSTMMALTSGPGNDKNSGARIAVWAQRWPIVTFRR